MTKKMRKLKPDIVLKNYWNNNERFADLFNAVLFEGKSVIRPEELEDVDTEVSSVIEHREYAESIEASRDNIKVQKKSLVYGIQFVMLGLESQEHIHYAMPLRVMTTVLIKSSMTAMRSGIRRLKDWKKMSIFQG